MKKTTLTLLLCASYWLSIAQTSDFPKKEMPAYRIETAIKLDGLLDEAVWQDVPAARQFIQHLPIFGAKPAQPSEVKILYDDSGIYIGAILYDSKPDSILQELSQRDQLGNTDWFGVFIDPYRDGINGVAFVVTPANVQFDAKISAIANNNNGNWNLLRGEDKNWDAVWESKTRITPEGWVVEMKIPYAALRFPKTTEQTWHINFGRVIRRHQQRSYWNAVNPQQDGFFNQAGYLTGIRDIKSPVRLQATPFVAVYGERYHDRQRNPVNSFGHSFNGGMDIKYGINDAFTLDMTLIPDFGEAQSDNQVLNLSPFEVRFDENRQFFTEGTELFNKGGLFYSRRIGGTPLYYGQVAEQLQEGEKVVRNPQQPQLYNATKISGRTEKGLGVGFFNATSGRSYATVRNVEGVERQLLTDPLTNFNVLVLDQNLKHNSYVTLINTTVLREGEAYDANVTGAVFDVRNKANAYSLSGQATLSQRYFSHTTDLGHKLNFTLRKISGNIQWELGYNEDSDTYNPNDLGFQNLNNQRWAFSYIEYNRIKPFWRFNRGGVGVAQIYAMLYNPAVYYKFSADFWSWAEGKNFWNYNIWGGVEPFITYDFFEPRTPGRYYHIPTSRYVGSWMGTDTRKRYRFSGNINYRHFSEQGRYNINFSLGHRLRVNDKLNFQFSSGHIMMHNDIGFVNKIQNTETIETEVIFGRRHRLTVENVLSSAYNFNENMTVTFRLRHYWSKVGYHSFHLLQKNGHPGPTDYMHNHDANFDAFNIDMIYRWRFAPGSDIFIVWKNAILDFEETALVNYFDNLSRLLQTPNRNNLSIKVIYFLDYNNMMSKRR
ncbi:MAG TPA: DUF5916 domain-containing protein [Saprospiraceae bacterium]|mgnify:CR=1 FL=1|nr:DUF5916 domain-containing protein [Saprospiraceae bacterium]HMP22542.1 DUF5916 domain-containing protein [Saprospiraceae bacterium]